MNPERRQSLRQIPRSLIYLDLEPSNGGIVLDLSEQGMQISLANPLASARQICFSLCLRPKHRLRGTGKIAWISASGRNVGVRFVSLPPESLLQIRECLTLQPDVAEPMDGEWVEAAGVAAIPAEAPLAAPSLSSSEKDIAEETARVPLAEAREAEQLPSILSLYDRDRHDELPASLLTPAPAEGSAPERAQMSEPDLPCRPDATHDCDAADESTENEFRREEGAGDPADSVEKEKAKKGETAPVEKNATAPESTTPSPPPPWLEALIEAGRRQRDEDMLLDREPTQERTEPAPAETGKAELEGASAEDESQPALPAPPEGPPTALYLPNYQIKPDRKPEAAQLSKSRVRDNWDTAMKLALERFEEFGWTLERDWHIWVALVLVGAGFLALAQDPPLPLVAAALWVASAVVAVKRKQRPRPPGQADSGRQ